MGVIRWLDRIDPDRFRKAAEVISTAVVKNLTDVESLCERLSISEDEDTLDGFRDALDEGDDFLMSISFNGLLETYSTVQTWDVDKALDRGLQEVFYAVPDLEPLAGIVDFKGADIDLPVCARNIDNGLFVVWSSKALEPAVSVAKEYRDFNSLKHAVGNRSYTFIEKILGKPRRYDKVLNSGIPDDYFELHWASMREAIIETNRAGQFLGMGMSP